MNECGPSLHPIDIFFNHTGLQAACTELEQCASSMDVLLNDLEDIHPSIFQLITRLRLRILKNDISREIEDMLRMKRALDAVYKKYDNNETAIVSEAVI